MRVEPVKQAAFEQQMSDSARHATEGHSAAGKPQGRALVVTEAAALTKPAGRPRQATFLAHLIATKEQAPQTRERRRAEPTEAIAAYRAVVAITG
jgi:hypothetical protein